MPTLSPIFTSEDNEKIVYTYNNAEFRNTVAVTGATLLGTSGLSLAGYLPIAGPMIYEFPSTYYEPRKTRILFNADAFGDCLNGVTGAYQYLPFKLKSWGVLPGSSAIFQVNGAQRSYNMQRSVSYIETSERITNIELQNLQVEVADNPYYNTSFFTYSAGAVHYLRLILQTQIEVFKKWPK